MCPGRCLPIFQTSDYNNSCFQPDTPQRLDLDEHQRRAIPGDNVEFPGSHPPVSCEKRISFGQQQPRRSLLPATPEFIEAMNGRLIAIYTGRQRLARSLLQDVIRHWYAREPSILQAVTDLRRNSEVCRQAIRDGDLEAVGRCLSKYWESKRVMAPQSEPKFVVEMREALDDIILGSSLAGAGGGGFFLCITKEADQLEEVKRRLSKVQGVDDMMFMRAQINMKGLEVTIGEECIGNPLVKQ